MITQLLKFLSEILPNLLITQLVSVKMKQITSIYKWNGEISMVRQKELDLAKLIVMLDLFRDQLFEQLLKKEGMQAMEILRKIQNDDL
ncbi:hypothetical protein [Mesobacillus stamsii]|nr:hypothetical protein [Mesobacillus stamsii]